MTRREQPGPGGYPVKRADRKPDGPRKLTELSLRRAARKPTDWRGDEKKGDPDSAAVPLRPRDEGGDAA